MIGCLSSGISGLITNNSNMSVIANNIANVNTPGFKLRRANFADVLSQQLGNLEIGNGVNLSNVSSVWSQGSLEASSNVTDLAIDGSGYFILKDKAGISYYTRAGQFEFDKQGTLVSPEGYLVQGWNLQESENLTDINMSEISIHNLTLPPQSTQNVEVTVNLDANAQVPANPFSINDSTSYNYSNSLSVVDSLGNKNPITIYFRKSAANQWEWYAFSEQGGTSTQQASGTLTFDQAGALDTESAITYAQGSGFDFGNGSLPDQAINIDFGGSKAEGESGTSGTTQFAAESVTSSFYQDGYESGSLIKMAITRIGVIQGLFSNGQTLDIAQIAMADFSNPQGLKHMGKNLYIASNVSGQPAIGQAETGRKGSIISYNLETSNVDLATEFMKMIITQRAFQANARSITTADQLLTELVNLKR